MCYYGARYYDPKESLWHCVDPLAEKYPHRSPYNYCSNNPLNIIDPDGRDEWEVNAKGQVKWIKESKKHTLFTVDKEGNRTGNSLTMKSREVFDQLASGTESLSVAKGDSESQGNMIKSFLFLADNTDVEWRMDRYKKDDGSEGYALGSNHSLDEGGVIAQDSPSSEDMGHSGSSVISFVHSHPGTGSNMDDEVSSMGWWPRSGNNVTIAGDAWLKKNSNLVNSNYYTYFPNSGRLYLVRNRKAPMFIRNVKSSYKRFLFGTLNSK